MFLPLKPKKKSSEKLVLFFEKWRVHYMAFEGFSKVQEKADTFLVHGILISTFCCRWNHFDRHIVQEDECTETGDRYQLQNRLWQGLAKKSRVRTQGRLRALIQVIDETACADRSQRFNACYWCKYIYRH